MMDYKRFFEKYDNYCPTIRNDMKTTFMEDLYQSFKARLIAEASELQYIKSVSATAHNFPPPAMPTPPKDV